MRLKIERLRDFERDPSNNFLTRSEMMEAVKELIALRELKGEQVPVECHRVCQVLIDDAWVDVSYGAMENQKKHGVETRILFTAPQKPVVPVGFLFVVKATGAVIYSIAEAAIEGTQLIGQIYGDAAIEAAGGIVKDGE